MTRYSLPPREALGRFIGREGDLARLSELVAQGERLITLVGAPGVGKTRLAIEHAARADHAVVFCDLGGARSPDEAAASVAAAAGVVARGNDPSAVFQHLAGAIAARGSATLVLDHVDGLIAHAEAIVSPLLANGLRVLVTSREILHLAREWAHELMPLRVPAVGEKRSEAVDLLLERIQRRRRQYVVDDDELALLGEIARRLDGIPLALELASERVSMLGAANVVARLDATLRSRTLRSAIEWSWNLLGSAEKSVLAQCAVFHGRFSLEAIEAVVVPDDETTLDAVNALRERSFLSSSHDGDGARFSMYASIRDFATEMLAASTDSAAVAERHAAYYLAPTREARDDQRTNLEAIADRALSLDTANGLAVALHALVALEPIVLTRGPIAPYAVRLDRALGRPDGEAAVRQRALLARARCRRRQGAVKQAEADQREVLAWTEGSQDRALHARALSDLSMTLFTIGHADAEALALWEQAIPLHAELGDDSSHAIDLARSSFILHRTGDLVAARSRSEAALAIHARLGNIGFEALALAELASIALEHGDVGRAREGVERAVELCRQEGDRFNEGLASVILAQVEHAESNFEAATTGYAEARRLLREVGYRRYEVVAQAYFALLLMEQGNVAEALRELEQATSTMRALGGGDPLGTCIALLGGATAASGAIERAERCLDEAEELLRAHLHAPLTDLQRAHLALARADASTDEAVVARHRGEVRRILLETEPTSFVMRMTMRHLRRSLARRDPTARIEAGPTHRLVVHPDGDAFVLPNGKLVECRRRQALKLLLRALVQRRSAHPGLPIAWTDLVRAAWPEQRILEDVAKNRLKVAITTLRKLGLGDIVIHEGDGYMLDPSVDVVENPGL